MNQSLLIENVPGKNYCEYISKKCSQCFTPVSSPRVLFLYPSQPKAITESIESAIELLNKKSKNQYFSWKSIENQGKIIFCSICKEIYLSKYLVCDLTNLNFNVLFELGYIIGLEKPFITIMEKTLCDKKIIQEIGLLDTIRYEEYINQIDISKAISLEPKILNISRNLEVDSARPIYYIKSPHDTPSSLRLSSILNGSYFGHRIYDQAETPRLSIGTAIQEVDKSRGVLIHLISSQREGAAIHNARCAFIAGLAMASQKLVLMLQEDSAEQPIDYKDIIVEYQNQNQINSLLTPFFKKLANSHSAPLRTNKTKKLSALESIDLGDIAAENESHSLKSYFVRTGEFDRVKKKHARLVTGRKGSGKTAIFYSIAADINENALSNLIINLKPEGYQFGKLVDLILKRFPESIAEHTLTSFWSYILLLEIAHKILNDNKEIKITQANNSKMSLWNEIKNEYTLHTSIEESDFSERLNYLIEKLIEKEPELDLSKGTPEITKLVYRHEQNKLQKLISEYLTNREIWFLIDNLDKNWKINENSNFQVLILKSLLEASRKLERELKKKEVDFHSIVFIRNDIYSFYLKESGDKGKDPIVPLLWNDIELFKRIFHNRVIDRKHSNDIVIDTWAKYFDVQVNNEDSFNYIIKRTFMRPRDFLLFIRHCMQTAISRGDNIVTEEDILKAEEQYSRDLFYSVQHEILDIAPAYSDLIYHFIGSKRYLTESELFEKLKSININENNTTDVIDKLLWFCFLGVCPFSGGERYAFQEEYDIKKLKMLSEWDSNDSLEKLYCIHPGFNRMLELSD